MQPHRILVAFTGGTIGSREDGNVINVRPGHTYRLVEKFKESGAHDIDFDVIEPISILSENASPADWTAIAQAVISQANSTHQGVIITHGTDTLSFVAAAMSYALSGIGLPTVLVASDLPLDDARANGNSNFRDAVEVILRSQLEGVYVIYRNPDGRRLLHRGVKVLPPSPLHHHVKSVGDTFLAEFTESNILAFKDSLQPNPGNCEFQGVRKDVGFSDKVLLIHPYPGLNYDRIDIAGLDAVVHGTYHSGTASNSHEKGRSIVNFGLRCRAERVPLICSPIPGDIGLYGSSTEFESAGINLVPTLTSDTAYVKASYGSGLGLTGKSLVDFIGAEILADEFA